MRTSSLLPKVALFPILASALMTSCGSSKGQPRATAMDSTANVGPSGGVATVDGAGEGAIAPAGDGAPAGDAGSCTPDPLRTGLAAQQTGISVDAFDCPILEWTAKYNEPDPMIFKAIIYVESRFDDTAVACPNDPCGTPSGWMASESGCFGLMQVVPSTAYAATRPDIRRGGVGPSGTRHAMMHVQQREGKEAESAS